MDCGNCLKFMKNKVFAIISCAIALASCNQPKTQTGVKENYYETMEVSLSDRTLTTGYSAAISGVQTVEIRPQVSGMITDILIEEGESVTKGQVLFVIDQTPYKAAYEIAVANVKSAEAALSTAKLILNSNKNPCLKVENRGPLSRAMCFMAMGSMRGSRRS